MRSFFYKAALALTLLTAAVAQPSFAADQVINVSASASLEPALKQIAEEWRKDNSIEPKFSFGSASTLAKQIQNGAPADIFISADERWMDWLQSRDLIRQDSRKNLLGNSLALIAAPGVQDNLKIEPGFPLASAIGDSHLAMGDPDNVPVGTYAQKALQKLNVWTQVEPLIARTEHVRAALALVARGEAKYGIVYKTDALSEPRVRLVGLFPPSYAPDIAYPAALTITARSETAAAFLNFLSSPKAKAIFEKAGFVFQPG